MLAKDQTCHKKSLQTLETIASFRMLAKTEIIGTQLVQYPTKPYTRVEFYISLKLRSIRCDAFGKDLIKSKLRH